MKRFWDKVDKTKTCWEWIARLNAHGYGTFKLNNKSVLAHRVSYEWERKIIEKGFEIDHLCRNRKCVRPDHLEEVTHAVNVARGNANAAKNSRMTTCKLGHEFYVLKNGKRRCRICYRQYMRDRARKIRGENGKILTV